MPSVDFQAKAKVLVAMSGGVDSSVAAALLVEAGYEVVGVFMRLGSPGDALDELIPSNDLEPEACKIKIGKQGCCSINDAADARLVAAQLGIPFYVCNFKKEFGRIIDYFVESYAAGETPNPCVRCNDWLKFGKLHEYAKQIGAEYVASGHYAQVVDGEDGEPRLLRGVDRGKDQSYVLFGAPRDRLTEMMLPIGQYPKSVVREMAKERGLPVFDKPDSQEICFVPDNDYAGLVERKKPELAEAGTVLDVDGNEVGEHGGHHHFTIGQRRGVGVAMGYPIYVVDKNPKTNTVTVGPKDALAVGSIEVRETNWLVDSSGFAGDEGVAVLAKYRYNTPEVPARVRGAVDGRFEVVFDELQHGVAPGQAVVIYGLGENAERVLGGGWISRTDRRERGGQESEAGQ